MDTGTLGDGNGDCAALVATALPGVACPTNFGSCTAGDVTTAVYSPRVLNNDDCADGMIDVEFTMEYASTAAQRYDLGIFVSLDGDDVNNNDSCVGAAVQAGDGNESAFLGDPDTDLFLSLDPDAGGTVGGDTCGDLDSSEGPVRYTVSATVACVPNLPDNAFLKVASCRVWEQNAGGQHQACTDLNDAGTGSKCDCEPLVLEPITVPVCGDGVIEPPETCDDGNTVDGDGCSAMCQVEAECVVDADCDNGLFCDGAEICTAGVCEPGMAPVCDDGLFCTGTESCNEDTDSCDSSGDPCSGAECNTCQEDTDTCFDPAGTTCGGAGDGVCDLQDTCDGAGICQDNVADPATVCRASAGVCDVAETCDGAGACPADAFEPATTVCNPGSGDSCDPDELCTGTGVDCPADIFEPSTTVCNAGSGDLCDPDEFCTGNPDETCPADVITPAGEICNPGSGDLCDPDEACTGVADEACPADVFEPATTVCNPGSGDICDPDELCTGNPDEACPADVVTPQGEVCNPGSGDLCDPDEVCSGVADEACPDDFVEPPTTVCNPSSTGDETCDPSEYCTGDPDVTCPADFIAPAGTACGDDSITDCSLPDTCDGAGTCEFNNRVCGSVTSSSLCEFDVEADKGTCVGGALDGAACSLALADENCIPVEGICEGGDLDGASCVIANGDADCTGGGVCAGAGVCEQSDQFRVAFAPDGHNWVAYKLNATTPGQFYYNAIYDASAASDGVTIGFDIPYPFVTQGATPLHVYDAELVGSNGEGCLAPENALVSEQTVILLDDWIQDDLSEPPYTAPDYLACDQVQGPGGSGFCILTFDIPQDVIDATVSGLLYVNLHLDFGLKGPHVDANPFDGFEDRYDRAAYVSPWGSSDALVNTDDNTGELALADCQAYDFSHADVGGVLESDTVENLNIFKKIAGAFGRAYCSDDDGALGVEMGLQRISDGEIVATAEIDGDGYYAVDYSHRGKPTEYRLVWTDGVNTHVTAAFGLKGNSWVEIDLTAVNACDDLDDPAPNDWLPIEPVCGPGNCK